MSEQTRTPDEVSPSGARHPVSIGHLVMGFALLGLAAVWALLVSDAVAVEDIRFLLPVPWVAAGVAGLVALVASDRRALAIQRSARKSGTPPHSR